VTDSFSCELRLGEQQVWGGRREDMDRRERLRRCYFGEELDRPAVYTRTGYPREDPTYDRLKAYMEAHTELKAGWSGVPLRDRPPGCSETVTEPCSDDYARRRTVVHTPTGDLEETQLVSLKGQPNAQEKYLLSSRSDVEKYLSLPAPEVEGDVAGFFEAVERMGDRGIVEVTLGQNVGFVNKLIGSELFAVMSVTDRDMIHALCERRSEAIRVRLEYLLERGVGPYFSTAGQEQLTPPLHGPVDFEDFNVRYDRPHLDRVHEVGGRVHVHCHGSVRRVFPGLLAMGADVLHPFEAPPMGDIVPSVAKSLARDRICLEGNLQIDRLYEATPAEIRAETEALIRATFDDHKGLIVCPTASPYIRGEGERCFPQYVAMVETVLEWEG